MGFISYLWDSNNEIFKSKKVQQIISILGEGKLRDGNETSKEFRELLNKISTEQLNKYADECLQEKWDGSGFALQDIVNQLGYRLGFSIIYGRYRGIKNTVGFDGVWTSIDNYNFVIEVKTTDAYRINLDNLAKYRDELIYKSQFSRENSSILIIVGRIDIGDLEAQILGSRHSQDIRLVSVDALFKLLSFKEHFDEDIVIHHINSILRPIETTKLDKIIDLIYLTANKFALNSNIIETSLNSDLKALDESNNLPKLLTNPYEDCIQIIGKYLNSSFSKESQTCYTSKDNKIKIVLNVSKKYSYSSNKIKYWFSFYPKHKDFLFSSSASYVALCCGTSNNLFLIPFEEFQLLLPYMTTSTKKSVTYWHIVIYEKNSKFILRVPKNNMSINLEKFRTQ